MKTTAEQDHALNAVGDWMKTDQQLFRLFGYAGTGKTTLASHIAEGTNGEVLFAAYTGKAAEVLTSKGCEAETLHQLIYQPIKQSHLRLQSLERRLRAAEGRAPNSEEVGKLKDLVAKEKVNLARPKFKMNYDSKLSKAKLLIIDECSMVDAYMGKDILSFGTKTLVLGDPAQLPPVGDAGGFFTEADPDFMLTGIHRQAADSPIIAMATRVREGKPLLPGKYGNCNVFPDMNSAEVDESTSICDQLLCGKNDTRHTLNEELREIKGHTGTLPRKGERLICLRNNHELDFPLLNGQIWIAAEDGRGGVSHGASSKTYVLLAHTETDETVRKLIAYRVLPEPESYDYGGPALIDYGYCLTCHKAQGSQWKHVTVLDESRICWRKKGHPQRWLYTAITRAENRVDVIQN